MSEPSRSTTVALAPRPHAEAADAPRAAVDRAVLAP
jgi:hypothetical protein